MKRKKKSVSWRKWTPEQRDGAMEEICRRIAQGESLRSILASSDHLPSHELVCRWLAESNEWAEQYARAREQQADLYFEEVVQIADAEDDPQRARVRIDARKWVAAKLRPKVYGDRLQVDADIDVRLDDAGLRARITHLLRKAGAGLPVGGVGEAEGEA